MATEMSGAPGGGPGLDAGLVRAQAGQVTEAARAIARVADEVSEGA